MSTTERVALITGAGGQLGRALAATAPPGWRVVPCASRDLDITDAGAVERAVAEVAPRLVLNAAAYTAVDRAEAEPDRAFAVNARGPRHLARALQGRGARLIHLSTDFVFAGDRPRPYRPGDRPDPGSVYGRSKQAGDEAVMEETGGEALVVRTSWVYGAGGANFVNTMLRLMGEREEIGVVADQVGTPTWTGSLARALWAWADLPRARGFRHWSDAGVASWYDFAVAIAEEGRRAGLLDRECRVRPIATEDYPTPAVRPAWSVLDKRESWEELGIEPLHWREALRQALAAWERN